MNSAWYLQKTKIPARGLKHTLRLISAFDRLIASKNQNPREGIETISPRARRVSSDTATSKNQNPREGIETVIAPPIHANNTMPPSKNQNPREGIETRRYRRDGARDPHISLQKTKIPARGLKHFFCLEPELIFPCPASKNQNPREGIETVKLGVGVSVEVWRIASKNQNPREGIETELFHLFDSLHAVPLQKTKIPARGLKQIASTSVRERAVLTSKNQNPREGIETRTGHSTDDTQSILTFKKPKSPRGD